MKWWVLRPDRATYDFRQGDEVVRFAEAHQMKVRGHCLVWGRYNPDWLTQGHFTPRQLSRLLREHITRVMKHYRGQVFAWDVVNEVLDENGNPRDSLWYNQPGIGLSTEGTAYIEQVFRWAHKADPHALLFYNEAEGEGMNRKSDAIYAMVRDFKRRGVPIDGVGLQMHIPTLDAGMAGDRGHFLEHRPAHSARRAGSHHGTGRLFAFGFRRLAQVRGLDAPGGGLSRHRQGVLEQRGLYGDPDLGIYRQVFVDRIPFARHPRPRAAL